MNKRRTEYENPHTLKCEYLTSPLGIQSAFPRLSWVCEAENNEYGKKQTAYRIVAASSAEKLSNENYDL